MSHRITILWDPLGDQLVQVSDKSFKMESTVCNDTKLN